MVDASLIAISDDSATPTLDGQSDVKPVEQTASQNINSGVLPKGMVLCFSQSTALASSFQIPIAHFDQNRTIKYQFYQFFSDC